MCETKESKNSDEPVLPDDDITYQFACALRDSAQIIMRLKDVIHHMANNDKNHQKYKDVLPLVMDAHKRTSQANSMMVIGKNMDMNSWHNLDEQWMKIFKMLPSSFIQNDVKKMRKNIEKLALLSSRHLSGKKEEPLPSI